MSSMRRFVWTVPFLLLTAPASAQYSAPYATPAYSASSVTYAIADWRRLRQSSGYSFADYARFVIANPDWPDEDKLRRWAERAMRPGESPATVLAFFAQDPPTTGNGFARLAEALAANGRTSEALAAAPTSANPVNRRSGSATARASLPPTTTAGSMRCCSPSSPTPPRASIP
jgi:soluble lytic murein transglycosylase